MTLEEKLARLKQIQELLWQQKVPLSESVQYIEEAMKLKKEIDSELSAIENKLVQLTKSDTV